VFELLREELTANQIASKYEIHRSQLNQWKKAVMDGIHDYLSDGRKRDKQKQTQEEVIKELHAQIGELTMKLNWLKKKSGIEV
jgi:transposase